MIAVNWKEVIRWDVVRKAAEVRRNSFKNLRYNKGLLGYSPCSPFCFTLDNQLIIVRLLFFNLCNSKCINVSSSSSMK